APQESVTSVRLSYFLLSASSVFHFCNPRRIRAAHPTSSVYLTIADLMIGIENHRNNLLFQEPQIDIEIVAFTPDKLRVDYLGLVDVLVIVVFLDDCKYFSNARIRNERGCDPIVDQTVGHLNRPTTRPELRENLSSTNFVGALSFHVGPEEWPAVAESLLHFHFRVVNVSIKGFQGPRVQLHMVCRLRHCSRPFVNRDRNTTSCQCSGTCSLRRQGGEKLYCGTLSCHVE